MNESMYVCAASLCCCLVVCSLVKMIAPSNYTTKVMSLVISVFSLCCLFSPVVNLIKGFDVSNYEQKGVMKAEEYSDVYDENVLRVTGEYISEYICTVLSGADIEVSSVKTVMASDPSGGIYISDVVIYLKKESMNHKDDIVSLLKSELGVTPKITEC